MARTQEHVDQPFTKVPNDWLEAVANWDGPPAVLRLLLAVARETWGWGQPSREVALTKLQEITGLSRARLYVLRDVAVSSRLLEVLPGGGSHASIYSIQADQSLWLRPQSVGTKHQQSIDAKPSKHLPTVDTNSPLRQQSVDYQHTVDSPQSVDTDRQHSVDAPYKVVKERERKTPQKNLSCVRKAHLQERLDEILGQMNPTWEVPLAFAYLEAAAAENKTGQVMLGRQISLLQALLKVKQDLDLDAYRYGLEAAVAKGAANPNYVKRAAGSYQRNPRPVPSRPPPGPMPHSAFGTKTVIFGAWTEEDERRSLELQKLHPRFGGQGGAEEAAPGDEQPHAPE